MLLTEDAPRERPIQEAEENLRIIRGLMERSTKHSTFSGLSGVLAGIYSIGGCAAQVYLLPLISSARPISLFLTLWSLVVLLAIGTDFVLTKRKAVSVGKTIRSRLGRQMVLGAGPALGTGALLTLFLAHLGEGWPLLVMVYPIWMLCYGTAVCAVGLFSQKEVARLGWAFIGAGAVTLLVQLLLPPGQESLIKGFGLLMTAVTFGGFHIVYGIAVSRRDGW
jgi:hypothetical protein